MNVLQRIIPHSLKLHKHIPSTPHLQVIGGNAYIEGWTGSAPKLKEIEGTLEIRDWSGTAPKLSSVDRRKFQWAKFWKS